MTSIQRAWRGGRNDWRLHALSIFSVSVAFVCMASTLLVVTNVSALRDTWAKAGRASVYLDQKATAAQVREIQAALGATPGVRAARHVTSAEARKEIVGSSSDELLAALPDEAFPASIEVTLDDDVASTRLESLSATLEALPAVEAVETYGTWTNRLASLLSGGVAASILLAAVVLAAVVSVVASTIRLTLQRRRVEVEVMKLVGATDEYVRRPFVIEGAMQGATGALLATLLLAVLFAIVQSHLDGGLALLIGFEPTFLSWSAIFGMIACGGALGAVAAYASLRRLMVV